MICDTYNPQNTENDFDPHQRSPTMLPDPDNLSDVYMPSRHYSQNVRFCEGTAMWNEINVQKNDFQSNFLILQYMRIFFWVRNRLLKRIIGALHRRLEFEN